MSGSETVGSASVSGATEGLLRSVRATRCHASAKPQALWVFSSMACGLYGYDDLSISHWAQRTRSARLCLSLRDGCTFRMVADCCSSQINSGISSQTERVAGSRQLPF